MSQIRQLIKIVDAGKAFCFPNAEHLLTFDLLKIQLYKYGLVAVLKFEIMWEVHLHFKSLLSKK